MDSLQSSIHCRASGRPRHPGRQSLLLALALLFVPFAQSAAYVVDVPVRFVRITSPHADMEVRILCAVELPQSVRTGDILSAHLYIPCGPQVETSVQIQIVSRPWSESTVGWANPWQTPGGDFQPALLVLHRSSPEEATASFDVSSLLWEFGDRAEFHGFCIRGDGGAIRSGFGDSVSCLDNGILRVYFVGRDR